MIHNHQQKTRFRSLTDDLCCIVVKEIKILFNLVNVFYLTKKFLHTPPRKRYFKRRNVENIKRGAIWRYTQISKCIYSFGLIPTSANARSSNRWPRFGKGCQFSISTFRVPVSSVHNILCTKGKSVIIWAYPMDITSCVKKTHKVECVYIHFWRC